MKKVLFISGSARNGNCKEILETLQKDFWLEYSTEVIFLRDFDLTPCHGCNGCKKLANYECVYPDKLDLLMSKVLDAEIVVLATPSYFYNVSSLTKNFIDKTYPCYNQQLLKNKKFIYIYTGEDSPEKTQKHLDSAMWGFSACHNLNVLGTFAFSCVEEGEFKDPHDKATKLKEISNLIRKYLNM